VEVAEKSYRIDRRHKASLYARGGIADYWIIDLMHDVLEVHREPEAAAEIPFGWRYRRVEILSPPASVSPLIAPDRSIPVADLLP
jgi:Uma2 family endonuclease